MIPLAPVLSGQPSSITSSRSASIAFSGDDSASFTCSVDGGAYGVCVSPKSLTGLSEGAHSLAVKQTDSTGTVGPESTVNWTVDLTAPGAPVVSTKPSALTNSASGSFSFNGEANASFTCSLDGGAFASCSSPASFSNLAEGSHSFSVKQTDQAGNVGPASSLASWSVDLTPPTAPVLSGAPAALSNLKTVKISFTAATDKTFLCSLDGATPSACNKSVSLAGLSEGNHTFVVSHSDPAGNVSSATATWTVDSTPPVITTSPLGSRSKTKTATTYQLTTALDPSGIVKAEYTTLGRPSSTAKPVASKTIPFANPLVFTTSASIKWIRIQDGAGNWSRWYIA